MKGRLSDFAFDILVLGSRIKEQRDGNAMCLHSILGNLIGFKGGGGALCFLVPESSKRVRGGKRGMSKHGVQAHSLLNGKHCCWQQTNSCLESSLPFSLYSAREKCGLPLPLFDTVKAESQPQISLI